jgi:hypothetical protein
MAEMDATDDRKRRWYQRPERLSRGWWVLLWLILIVVALLPLPWWW